MKRHIQLVIETQEEKTNSEMMDEIVDVVGEIKQSLGCWGWEISSFSNIAYVGLTEEEQV